jgi:hypothetical protein
MPHHTHLHSCPLELMPAYATTNTPTHPHTPPAPPPPASPTGDALGGVLDIIATTQPGLNTESEEEVELDMDTLADEVLWKLKAYVDGVNRAPAAPKSGKTTSGRSGLPDGVAGGGQPEQQSRPPDGDGDNNEVDGDGDVEMAEEGGEVSGAWHGCGGLACALCGAGAAFACAKCM